MNKDKGFLVYSVIGVLALIAVLFLSEIAKADSVNVHFITTDYNYSSPTSLVLDDSSSGIGITYGVELSPSFQLDIGYADLGSAEQTFTVNTQRRYRGHRRRGHGGNSYNVTTKAEATAFNVALHGSTVLGTIAAHNIKGHALLGIMRADMDINTESGLLSDTDTGLLVGVGISAWLSPMSAVTVMYKKADLDFANTVNFEYDPSMIEAGFTRRF